MRATPDFFKNLPNNILRHEDETNFKFCRKIFCIKIFSISSSILKLLVYRAISFDNPTMNVDNNELCKQLDLLSGEKDNANRIVREKKENLYIRRIFH